MPTLAEALAIAINHHQSGQLQTAEQIYRQILAADPNQADALHLLGILALQTGNPDAAVQLISRAIDLDATEPGFHFNLGNAYQALGKPGEAVACFRRALELNPNDAAAHYNLANALQQLGKLAEAVDSYRRAIELKPDQPESHSNLGAAFKAQGKLDEAVASYRRALDLNPDDAIAYFNLGTALADQGKLDEAINFHRSALELKPVYPGAHYNLGNILVAQGQLDEAIDSYCRAIALEPSFAEAHANLGTALLALDRHDEAIASCRRTLKLKPSDAHAHYNLGTALQAQGKLDEAVGSYRRAIELDSCHAGAHNNLGTVFSQQGRFDDAVECYHRTLQLKPDYADAWGNLLLALQYRFGAAPSDQVTVTAEYERLQAAPLRMTWRPHENDRSPGRRLCLGFVSPGLGHHPVGYFLIRVIENLVRRQCDVVCYSDRNTKDELTTRFEAAASTWRDVRGWSDPILSEQIRTDRIDILFDLSGHTAKNRLLVFARKPAPIQVTWAGYAGTTGLSAMDYILADRYEIPPSAEAHYSERVLRMPDGYVCYDPPAYAPAVSPLPALNFGSVTFGSFNNPAKLSSQILEVWARILDRVPRSRLVLKYRGMDFVSVAQKLAKDFSSLGIDPLRIQCLGWSPHRELLSEYNRIDLALDPFPYNGGLTTCESLWMGVPVITCPGEAFPGRHSLSHLTNVGLPETVARDFREYVDLSVSLTADLPCLADLRAGLRKRMAASPLCDGRRFAENLFRILSEIWRNWCEEVGQ